MRASSRTHSRQNLNSADEKPAGYDKVVYRMKKYQKEKEVAEQKVYKQTIGERYNKEKLNKVRPPSFLT